MKIANFTFDDPSAKVASGSPQSSAAIGSADIVSRFSEIVRLFPARHAVVDEEGCMSYAELDELSNRIADVLNHQQVTAESRVGVMIGRHRLFIAALFGVIKAGCVYLPIDPTLPLERRSKLLSLANAVALLASAETAGDMQKLEWMCPELKFSLTLDSDDVDSLIETPGELMREELWDHIAAEADDDIDAGGWKSAFTGLAFTPSAMAEFGTNALKKIAPLLKPGARVLEIGCASGFTMRYIAPLSASYLATDLSRHNAERVEVVARSLGMRHVTGRHLAAHDIDILPQGSFDLIILNSVIESFPGYGYLRMVLNKSTNLLAPGGRLFLGNLWDLERHDAYLADLAEFARTHADEGYSTRSNLAGSFFVPSAFFLNWAAQQAENPSIMASRIEAPGFDPAPYAFDVIISFEESLEGTPSEESRSPLHLDRRALFAEQPNPPEPSGMEINPRRAAYLIFTSGSSGQPKGVLVEHGPVINLSHAIEEKIYAPLLAETKQGSLDISCCFSFAFDGSIHQIFTPLLNGHTVHLPLEETRQDPERLHSFIESHRLNVVDATPSLFALLIDYWESNERGCTANCFILGGEALSTSLMERFYAFTEHLNSEVWNAYGPTETCVSASQYRMSASTWNKFLPPPVGSPLSGVDIKICDEAGRSMPTGIPGEIRIGGACLAREYLNEPELTARHFVLDEEGKRWYCTGDIGRWLQPGLLQFTGREDRQVKVRGYRIELSEVESALLASPLVRQAAVVVADPRNDGDRVLVAYIVANKGFDSGRCRADLDLRIPAWMMPTLIVEIDELPITSNGKIDERRLPSLHKTDRLNPNNRARKLFTRDTERKLAALWQKILDLPVESTDDDFFMLGGHSVLGIRLLSLIESSFGVKIPLTELFTSTTIARMADRIEARQEASAWHSVVAIHTGGSHTPLVCFHPVGGNVLCYKALAEALGSDWPLYMVQASGLEAGQALQPTIEMMVSGYLRELNEIIPHHPLIMAGWSFGGLLAWEAAHQLRQMGRKIESVIILDGIATPDPIRSMLQKDEADFIATLFDEMGLGSAEFLRSLTPEERLDQIVLLDRGGDYLPNGLDRQQMRRLLALFQNNGMAAVRYQPPASTEDLLLIRPRIPSSQAPGIPGDDYNGWSSLVGGKVELRWIDGTHGQMLHPPFAGQMADHIRQYIDRTAP
ncbi:MAG: methyltransferase domain-containing protein [Chlorobium sp.]|nr:MAG: methyltransferase domain-containing protein [Chlorobium sp.]